MEKVTFQKNENETVEYYILEQTRISGVNYLLVTDTEEDDGEAIILKEISAINSKAKIVGFCAESENLLENAKEKIQKKGCDYLVANDISRKDIGFSSDMNEVYILDKKLQISHIERDTKLNIAKKILEKIFE